MIGKSVECCSEPCQHPFCWKQRQFSSNPSSFSSCQNKGTCSKSATSCNKAELPTQKIFNMLADYGHSKEDRFPLTVDDFQLKSLPHDNNPEENTNKLIKKKPKDAQHCLTESQSVEIKRLVLDPIKTINAIDESVCNNKRVYIWVPRPKIKIPESEENLTYYPFQRHERLSTRDLSEYLSLEVLKSATVISSNASQLARSRMQARSGILKRHADSTLLPEGLELLLSLPRTVLKKVIQKIDQADLHSKESVINTLTKVCPEYRYLSMGQDRPLTNSHATLFDRTSRQKTSGAQKQVFFLADEHHEHRSTLKPNSDYDSLALASSAYNLSDYLSSGSPLSKKPRRLPPLSKSDVGFQKLTKVTLGDHLGDLPATRPFHYYRHNDLNIKLAPIPTSDATISSSPDNTLSPSKSVMEALAAASMEPQYSPVLEQKPSLTQLKKENTKSTVDTAIPLQPPPTREVVKDDLMLANHRRSLSVTLPVAEDPRPPSREVPDPSTHHPPEVHSLDEQLFVPPSTPVTGLPREETFTTSAKKRDLDESSILSSESEKWPGISRTKRQTITDVPSVPPPSLKPSPTPSISTAFEQLHRSATVSAFGKSSESDLKSVSFVGGLQHPDLVDITKLQIRPRSSSDAAVYKLIDERVTNPFTPPSRFSISAMPPSRLDDDALYGRYGEFEHCAMTDEVSVDDQMIVGPARMWYRPSLAQLSVYSGLAGDLSVREVKDVPETSLNALEAAGVFLDPRMEIAITRALKQPRCSYDSVMYVADAANTCAAFPLKEESILSESEPLRDSVDKKEEEVKSFTQNILDKALTNVCNVLETDNSSEVSNMVPNETEEAKQPVAKRHHCSEHSDDVFTEEDIPTSAKKLVLPKNQKPLVKKDSDLDLLERVKSFHVDDCIDEDFSQDQFFESLQHELDSIDSEN